MTSLTCELPTLIKVPAKFTHARCGIHRPVWPANVFARRSSLDFCERTDQYGFFFKIVRSIVLLAFHRLPFHVDSLASYYVCY